MTVNWADGVIEREDNPDWSICEVAMSARKYEPDVVSMTYAHPSDRGIVRELVERNYARAANAVDYASVEQCFLALLRDAYERDPQFCQPVAGALDAVRRFRALPELALSIATAGWTSTAQYKLAVAGDTWRTPAEACLSRYFESFQMKLTSTTQPRVVLFDADGVLQRRSPPSELLPALAELVPLEEAECFLEAIFAAERPTLAGSQPFRSNLEQVLRTWNGTADVDDVLRIWFAIEVDHSLLEVVRALREAGTVVGLASNQWPERARYMSSQFGYAERFDYLFYSCDLGVAKPDVRYFSSVLERLSARASDVLFLDDHQTNVDAARAVGLRASLFQRNAGLPEMQRVLAAHGFVL